MPPVDSFPYNCLDVITQAPNYFNNGDQNGGFNLVDCTDNYGRAVDCPTETSVDWFNAYGKYAVGFGILGIVVCGGLFMMCPKATSCHASKNTRGEYQG